MPIADFSPSTRCGVGGVPIAAAVARAIATIGMSAVFFQDPFGLVTFDAGFEHLAALRPRTGQEPRRPLPRRVSVRARPAARAPRSGSISTSLGGFVRRHAMLPVISDFLFDDVDEVIKELSLLNDHARRVPRPDRQRVRLRPAEGLRRLDRDLGRRDRPGAHRLRGASTPQLADRAREWQEDVQTNAAKTRPGRRRRSGWIRPSPTSRSANSSSNDACGKPMDKRLLLTASLLLGLAAFAGAQPAATHETGTRDVSKSTRSAAGGAPAPRRSTSASSSMCR